MKSDTPVTHALHRRKIPIAYWLTPMAFAATFFSYAMTHPRLEWDSKILLKGLNQLIDWRQRGARNSLPDISSFPLFQHLTGLILHAIHPNVAFIICGWSFINTASYAGCFIILHRSIRKTRGAGMAMIACLILLSGPLFWYAMSTYNEMAAALITLAFTAGVLARRPAWICAMLFFVAGLTKEIAFPFLAAIWILALWSPAPANRRRHFVALVIAVLATVAASAGFNELRYGTLTNPANLSERLIVRDTGHILNYFAGLWLSPNGGLLFFWPAFTVTLIAAAVGVYIQMASAKDSQTRGFPAAIYIIAILIALLWGLAHWYTPFGWWCYGPRLVLPWVPSLLLLLLHFHGKMIRSVLASMLASRRVALGAAIVLTIVSLPHIAVVFRPEIVASFFQPPGSDTAIMVPDRTDLHYQLTSQEMWKRSPLLLAAMSGLVSPMGAIIGILYIGAVVSLMMWARWELEREMAESSDDKLSGSDPEIRRDQHVSSPLPSNKTAL